MKITQGLLLSLFFSLCLACSGEKSPFGVHYTSPNNVKGKYMGKESVLNHYTQTVQKTPFIYNFESDGDLDHSVGGKHYEVDSPYDIDQKKEKSKKSTKTKKVTVTKKKDSQSKPK